jgi:nucleotide-binding universal stress UspA family protein
LGKGAVMAHPIVLGYDGSACSAAALEEAIELGRDISGATVVLVYCHEPPPGLSCALDRGCAAAKELRDYERRVESEVEPMLRHAADRVRAAGVEPEVVLVWDDPVRALEAVAHERGSHVIVVGSHGEGSLAGALRRHTPFELLHHSDVPVLVVPHRH